MAGVVLAGSMPGGILSIVQASADAAADLAVTNTMTDVSGASVTLSAQTSSAFYLAFATFDFDKQGAGASANIGTGVFAVDGVEQPEWAVARANVAAVFRGTFAQRWSGTLAAGSHTFKLRARDVTGTGVWTVRATHTGLTVIVFG